MKSFLALIILIPVFLSSCISTRPDLPPPPDFREPSKSAKVYKPKGEWAIRSEKDLEPLVKLGAKVSKSGSVVKVNLNGITIDGKNQPGDGSQNERQTPLFRAYIPLFVENGFFTNTKNAATFYKPNSGVKNITVSRIGEDGIATGDGAKNFTLENCEFKDASDKSAQLNEAAGAKIINNTIYGGITGVRVGKHEFVSKNDIATCSKNTFLGVDTAWNVGKMQLRVIGKNKYTNVRLPFKTSGGGKIKNADGTVENE